MEKATLVRELEKTLEELRQFLAGLSLADLESGLVTRTWRMRDVLAHLLTWAQEFRNQVVAIAEQGVHRFSYHISHANNFAEVNQEMIAPWRQVAGEQLVATLLQAEEEFLEAVRGLSDAAVARRAIIPYYENVERSVAEIVTAKDLHARKHLAGLQGWLARKTNPAGEVGDPSRTG